MLGYSKAFYETSDLEETKRYWKRLGDTKYIGDNDNNNEDT